MEIKHRVFWFSPLVAFALQGCGGGEAEQARINNALNSLELLANQIFITNPAPFTVITDTSIPVRADIPGSAGVESVSLYVDGIEIAADSDGAPWVIDWPSYFWADGGRHTLLLKATTGNGVEVRSNQSFSVAVSDRVNENLSFLGDVDGSQFNGTNTITLEVTEIPEANKYEVEYSGNETVNNAVFETTSLELTDLDVGLYEIRYRAVREYPEQTTLEGPWSEPISVEITPPELPGLNPPVITQIGSSYDVTFSWNNLGDGNTYNLYLNNLSYNVQTLYDSISTNTFEIAGLELGNYQWQLSRVNSVGHESLLSDSATLETGVFTRQLGGSNDDYAKKVILSSDGNYVILGFTTSTEISEITDSQGDDWVIKVDDEGNTVWDFVSNADGGHRFGDIIELSDGSFVLVGEDSATSKAVALKMDESGNEVWEVTYRPDSIDHRYNFRAVAELDGKLFASSEGWADSGSTEPEFFLHSLSILDGTVSDPVSVPAITGIEIDSARAMISTSFDQLLIAGSAIAEGADSEYDDTKGAYLQILNTDFDQLLTWNNVNSSLHLNVGDVIQLSNGNFAIIGQAISSGESAISVVSNTGSLIQNYHGDIHEEFYRANTIAEGKNGEIHVLLRDSSTYSNPYPLFFMSLNSSLSLESKKYLLNFPGYVNAEGGVVKNDDGTFTLVFNQAQDGNDNYDIIITKVLFD